jgi:xylulokinase
MDELLLGIDIGTTNCKAIVFDLHGKRLSQGSAPTPVYHPQPEWFEHDPAQIWQTVVQAIRQALVGIDAGAIRGVAIASFGEAGVLVDASGQTLSPMMAWHDARCLRQLEQWCAQIDQQWVNAITAMPARSIYTLFKLLWMREHWPDAYTNAQRWLFASDYIAYQLTGEQATDYSQASRSLMFDLRQRQWSNAILVAAGMPESLMPALQAAGTALGQVTKQAAAVTGLAAGTTVGIGGHDHIVGAFAAGVVMQGQCLDSMGTAEATFLPLEDTPPATVTPGLGGAFGAHVARDRTFFLDGLLSSGACLNWIQSILTPQVAGFAELEALAQRAPAGSRGALFLPRMAAEEHGAFAGINLACGAPEFARAVYEGLAYGWRELLEAGEAALGLRAEHIRVIGGGVRSPIWTQIKADVLGRPLELLDLDESVALGAAMLGGLAAGVYASEAEAHQAVEHTSHWLYPNAEQHAMYEPYYRARFLPLRQQLGYLQNR